MKSIFFRNILSSAAILLASAMPFTMPGAMAQENWAADDDALEARKIERYQQLVDQSPEKSYAFNQLMATVGKGAQYQKLLLDYEKKVAAKPQNFNLRMVLGHMYQYGGRTNEAIESYKKAIEIKKTPLAYMSIAAAEAENRNFEQAVTAYETASGLNPNKEQKQEIWRALAEIAIYRRDMARAQVCFNELIQLEPNSLFIRRELAQIYEQNKYFAQAREVLEDAKKIASSNDKDQIELDIAVLYEQEGNDDEALSRYEALSKKLGASHWMQRELSSRIIDIHRRKGNIAELAKVLEDQWKSPSYQQHLELANLYEETSNPDKALEHLKKAIASSPKLPEGHEKLVRFYRSHGQIEKMFEARKALIKAVPDNPDYRFELYEDYIQQKQVDKALGVLDETQKKFTDKFDVQRRVAEYYQMNGRSQKAQDIYESWVKKHPSDLEALEALGDHYDTAGEHKKAAATWQKIENLPIDKATKLETLARIYDEHGYASEAEELYAKTLAASPKDCYAHSQYADILTRNGKQVEAIEAWNQMARTCPAAPMRTTAARQLAALYKSRGAQKNAIAQYRGQCESHPNSLSDALLFASVAQALDMPVEAIPTLEAFTERNPSQTEALTALNELQAASGDIDAARKTLEKLATHSETEKRDAFIAMSDLDLQAGDLEAAQNHLSEALKLNANDADTHERLGDILRKRRMYQEAANNYETAFQIDDRNYIAAFKEETCLSILGKTKEADDLYVRIVTSATDETLVIKAAQRVIDDHTWLGTLDELSKSFMPLVHAKQRKALYLEILLSLADAQAQPHTLALLTRDAQHALPARHALRELGDKYASVLVESLLHEDPSISGKALKLSEWLTSSSVIAVLGQRIEKAPTSESGRLMQLQAIRAIAHAQLPAAVPVLKSCLDSHYPRALREHALWALGLIPAQSASDVLKEALDIQFDSFRAIAIIGLGRQNAHLDAVDQRLKEDPSPLVRDAAAWALAYNRAESYYKDIQTYYFNKTNPSKPYQLWTFHTVDETVAAPKLLENLWCGGARTAAAKLLRSENSGTSLSLLTQTEAQGKFIHGMTTHYQSNFDFDMLLNHFVDLSLKDTGSSTAWVKKHEDALRSQVKAAASGSLKSHTEDFDACKTQMLRDFVSPTERSGIDINDPEQRPILSAALTEIQPTLNQWNSGVNNSGGKSLADLSLRASAITGDLSKTKDTAFHSNIMALRIDAIEAMGMMHTPESKEALRVLSSDPSYLVRAAAVEQLDASDPEDRTVLERAQKDTFAIVAETAASKLSKK